MKPLKAAIVGCGGIAQVHGAVLSRQDTAQLTAVADILPQRAKAMAQTYGGRAYSSLEELLDHEEIDVLHICTPHFLHTPMAAMAADRGIRIFTEKPPVINESQWEEFQHAAQKTRIGICFQNRWNASVSLTKQLLSGGSLGEVLGARAFVTWHREAP